ncbi:unnamed protein product [Clonostachys byssicola]|uniref:Uncharacterized protein n=1 Tax=Clonostachys byssicola TaxID=160290 RepID=A0A9N9UTB3_9HYPO|nr:unnamed protein product [Clonostachys byssicola]
MIRIAPRPAAKTPRRRASKGEHARRSILVVKKRRQAVPHALPPRLPVRHHRHGTLHPQVARPYRPVPLRAVHQRGGGDAQRRVVAPAGADLRQPAARVGGGDVGLDGVRPRVPDPVEHFRVCIGGVEVARAGAQVGHVGREAYLARHVEQNHVRERVEREEAEPPAEPLPRRAIPHRPLCMSVVEGDAVRLVPVHPGSRARVVADLAHKRRRLGVREGQGRRRGRPGVERDVPADLDAKVERDAGAGLEADHLAAGAAVPHRGVSLDGVDAHRRDAAARGAVDVLGPGLIGRSSDERGVGDEEAQGQDENNSRRPGDDVGAGLGVDTVHVDLGVLDLDHVLLAVLSIQTLLGVVLEEAVQATTVEEDVAGVVDTETPSLGASLTSALGKGRIEVLGVGSEWGLGIRVALHVGSLGLDDTHEDVLGALEVVVVEDIVLRGGSPQPDGLGRLDEQTTAVVDVDLVEVGAVKLVVGNPEPVVLHVDATSLSDVHEHKGTNALRVGRGGLLGSLAALVGLQVGTGGTTNAEVDVPETGGALAGGLEVPLHEDGTGLRTLGLNHEVGNLNIANIAWLADLEHGLGRPDLTNNLDVLGNLDSVADDVGTVGEVDNLVLSGAVESSLDSGGIISLTVTLGTLGLDGNELGDINISVLRLAADENTASVVEENGGLGGSGLGGLDGLAGATSVGASLDEGGNLLVAGEDGGASSAVGDSDRDVAGEVSVVNDEGSVGAGLGRVVEGLDSDRSVGEDTVLDNDCADGLSIATTSQVKTNAAVLDGESVVVPDPVPDLVDGGVAVVEAQVAGSELLATEEGTVLSTVEDEIGDETTRSVLHEDTLLGVVLAAVLNHEELDVLERGGLGNLPVDTSTRGLGLGGDVNLEVANLSEEVVLVGEPVVTGVGVRVCVNDSHALEVGTGLEGGDIREITNHVSVVVGNDGLGDNVGTRGEVDESGSGGAGVAAKTASVVASSDGSVDGISVIRGTITLGTEVFDVTEDGVVTATGAEGNGASALNAREPP